MPHRTNGEDSDEALVRGHQKSTDTGVWETETEEGSGVYVTATAGHREALNAEFPDDTDSSASAILRDFVEGLSRAGQGNGVATEGEAIELAIAGGIGEDDIVIIPRNNRFFFDRKDKVPPEVESWSIFKDRGQVWRINSKNGDTKLVRGPVSGGWETFDSPDLAKVIIRLPDGTYISVARSASTSGQLRTELIPLTDKVLVTLRDGTTKVVDKAESEEIQQGINTGTVEFHEESGHFIVTQPDGSISLVKPIKDDPTIQRPETVFIGGQAFAFNPNTGDFIQVRQPPKEFEPDVVLRNGRAFIQDANGNLTPLEGLTLDQQIDRALETGNVKAAVALADFRDRPTSLELFNASLEFAQSPGDLAAISAIARGQSLVAPPPSGTVQRIAQQPEVLMNAFQKLFASGAAAPKDLIDTLEQIEKERQGEKKGRKAAEEKGRKSEEKVQQLNNKAAIDRALAEFRKSEGGSGRDPDKTGRGASTAIEGTSRFEAKRAEFIAAGFGDFDAVVAGFTGMSLEQIISGLSNTLESRLAASSGDGLSPTTPPTPPPPTAPPTPPPPRPPVVFDVEDPPIPPAPPPLPPPGDDLEIDFFARGGHTRGSNLEIVGEGGQAELVDLPPGTRVTPISKLSTRQVKKLREMGIRGMQGGGVTDPLIPPDIKAARERIDRTQRATVSDQRLLLAEEIRTNDPIVRTRAGLPPLLQAGGGTTAELPFGVRRALAGGIIEPTRRRLSTAAGIPILSAQARQNLLPEELEVFNRLSREAGIPEGAFRQEQESAFPGANLARGRARFSPRVLR